MKKITFYLLMAFATISLCIISCSKKTVIMDETETSTQKFYYGGIYNACDWDPQIFMNIDSLKKYCNRNNRLLDLLDTDSISQANFTSYMPCQSVPTTYDNPIGNWDFKISMGVDGYQLDWYKTPLSIEPVEVEIGFRERGKYPFTEFYKGYEVKTSDVQTVTVLFFNSWVGGCLHDYYVWELVEQE